MNARARIRGLYGLLRPRPDQRESVEAFQSACLRDLMVHAHRSIPYYRSLFDGAGLNPRDVQSVSDLAQVPITTRDTLQQLRPEDLCASSTPLHALRTVHTSGSSGEPLVVRRSMFEERLLLAYRARAVGAHGLNLRARRANIDHLSPDVVAVEGGELFYERLGIMPRLQLDWRRSPSELIEAIERFHPDVISGPPSILSWVAAELSDGDRARIGAKLILTGGETLTPSMRRDVEDGFGLPVADIYGSHEVVFIAMQTPGTSAYRVCEEAVIVEVVRDGQPVAIGESGEIVVTALHSRTMPFIRYRLGDRVTLGARSEGALGPYTTLTSIDGRTLDRFILPDGRELLGYSLGEVLEQSALHVRRFRITQHARDSFRVELALYADPPPEEMESVLRRMRSVLGHGVEVSMDVHTALGQDTRKFYPFIPLERLHRWDQSRPR